MNADDLKTRPYDELVKEYGHFLKIPRRPTPDQYGNAEELNAMENEMFLQWRRDLAQLTEVRTLPDMLRVKTMPFRAMASC